jgi:two-component system sensor histidine kinase AtoS
VIAANQAFLRRSGRSRDAVLGCCCRGADLGGCSVSECPARGCLETGDRQVRICERRTVEGGTAWEEVHASPIYGSSGRVVQVVEVWRDISERRAAEARLAESHRLASLGLLASGFSHELNTPLATILMAVEGIGREAQEVGNGASAWPRISDNAAIAREQVLRCRGITQQFLRLARGQASAVDIVELQASVAAVARLIEPTARAHAVRIHVEPGEAVQVRAGEAELQQALLNLLLNAVQACAEGGRVVVAARQGATAQARISVTDDGCGIAPGQQERIFEPFFSLRPGGTGLGLFLALNFVRAWGGDLLVESAPGRGSTFQIVLPLAEGTKGMEAHA